MGWASAGDIFGPVCEVLRHAFLQPGTRKKILVTLIKALQDGDWDTEHDSLLYYQDDPIVVEAFKECGVENTPFENTPGAW